MKTTENAQTFFTYGVVHNYNKIVNIIVISKVGRT